MRGREKIEILPDRKSIPDVHVWISRNLFQRWVMDQDHRVIVELNLVSKLLEFDVTIQSLLIQQHELISNQLYLHYTKSILSIHRKNPFIYFRKFVCEVSNDREWPLACPLVPLLAVLALYFG